MRLLLISLLIIGSSLPAAIALAQGGNEAETPREQAERAGLPARASAGCGIAGTGCWTRANAERLVVLPGGQRLLASQPGRAAQRIDFGGLLRAGAIERTTPMSPATIAQGAFFEQNLGHWDARARYVSQGTNHAVFAVDSGFIAVVGRSSSQEGDDAASRAESHAVRVTLIDALAVAPGGKGKLRAKSHRFVGRAQDAWRRAADLVAGLHYPGVYRGIDFFLTGPSGTLDYGFVLQPDAEVATIRMRVEGATRIAKDASGNLVLTTRGGPIVFTRPQAYEQTTDVKRRLKAEFVLRGDEIGFRVPGRNAGARLVIDPLIVFSTYFGGTGQEGLLGADAGAGDNIGRGFDVAVNPGGDVFVAGITFSPDFPRSLGPAINGSSDAFVMRFSPDRPDEPLVYATFLGGSAQDRGRAVTARADGSAFVSGFTFSNDFPVTAGTVNPVSQSGGFIARLAPDGTLERATMMSPRPGYHPNSIQIGPEPGGAGESLYVAGWVTASEASGRGLLASAGALQPTVAGGTDGFVAKLDPDLTAYDYFTYLGGSRADFVMDLDVLDGSAFVTGTTMSLDFPTTEFAAQPAHSGTSASACGQGAGDAPRCAEAFAARLRTDGSRAIYSTYLGSDATEDFARGIAVDRSGKAVVTGGARSVGAAPASSSIFATRLESLGGSTLYDVRIAGVGTDHGEEIVVDTLGRAHITGTIGRDGAATGIAAQAFLGGRSDFFYARIPDDTGSDVRPDFFTYLGGAAEDRGFAIATVGDTADSFCAHLVGSTTSADLRAVNAIQEQQASARSDLALVSLCDFPLPPVISKQAPATVAPGATFNYTIAVANPGDVPVSVQIRDSIPAGLTVLGVIGCGLPNGSELDCTVRVDGGSAVAIIVTVLAPTVCPRRFVNTATMDFGDSRFSATATTDCIGPPPVVARCGNGRLEASEQCDGGVDCSARCTRIVCGDEVIEGREQCDDGNRINGDECTNVCEARVRGACSASSPPCVEGMQCVRTCSVSDAEYTCFGLLVDGLCWGPWLETQEETILCQAEPQCLSSSRIDGNDRIVR